MIKKTQPLSVAVILPQQKVQNNSAEHQEQVVFE